MKSRQSDALLLVAILLAVGLSPAAQAWHGTPESEDLPDESPVQTGEGNEPVSPGFDGNGNPQVGVNPVVPGTGSPPIDRELERIPETLDTANGTLVSSYRLIGDTLNTVEDDVSRQAQLPLTLFRDGAGGLAPEDPVDAREGGFGEVRMDIGNHPWEHAEDAAYRGGEGYSTPRNEHGTYPAFASSLLLTPELDLRTHALQEPRIDSEGSQSMVLRRMYWACDLVAPAAWAGGTDLFDTCLQYRDMLEQQEMHISLEYRMRHNLARGNDGVAVMVFTSPPESIQDAELCEPRLIIPPGTGPTIMPAEAQRDVQGNDTRDHHTRPPACRVVLPIGGYSPQSVNDMPGGMAYTGSMDWFEDAIDLTPWEGRSVWVGFYFTSTFILPGYFESSRFVHELGFYGVQVDDLVVKSLAAPVNLAVRPLLDPSQPTVHGVPTMHPDDPIPVRALITNLGATAVNATVVTRILYENNRSVVATAPDVVGTLPPGAAMEVPAGFDLEMGRYIAQVCAYRSGPGAPEDGRNYCVPLDEAGDPVCTIRGEPPEGVPSEARQCTPFTRGEDAVCTALGNPTTLVNINFPLRGVNKCIPLPGSCSNDPLNADPCRQLAEAVFEVRPLQKVTPGPIRMGESNLQIGDTTVVQVPIRNEGNREETLWVQPAHVDLATLEVGQHLLPIEQRDNPVRVILAPGEETTLEWEIAASGQTAQYRFIALINATAVEQPVFDHRYDLLPDVIEPWRGEPFHGDDAIDGDLTGDWLRLSDQILGAGSSVRVGNNDTHLFLALTNVTAPDGVALFFHEENDTTSNDLGVVIDNGQVVGTRYDQGWEYAPIIDPSVVALSAGAQHSLAVTEGGAVYAWGLGASGRLGNGDSANSNTPVRVLGGAQGGQNLQNIVAVSAGRTHSLAVDKEGFAYAWGAGSNGRLGNNAVLESNTPVRVAAGEQSATPTDPLQKIESVSAGGDHSLAVAEDGAVYAWGFNDQGQLGESFSSAQKTTPIRVLGGEQGGQYLEDGVAVSAGDRHSLAVTEDGAVYAWGSRANGRLGDGATTGVATTPVRVLGVGGVGFLEDVVAVSAGNGHSLALTSDGAVYAWGLGDSVQVNDPTDSAAQQVRDGQLGDGAFSNSATPVRVVGGGQGGQFLEEIVAVSAGGFHSLAVDKDGFIYAWGFGVNGLLGNGQGIELGVPAKVTGMEDGVAVSAGSAHSLALTSDGLPFAWGRGGSGRLGYGGTGDHDTPIRTMQEPTFATFEDWGFQAARSGDRNTYELSIPINASADAHMPALTVGPGDTLQVAVRFCPKLTPGGAVGRPCGSHPHAVPVYDGGGFAPADGDLGDEAAQWQTLRLGDPSSTLEGGTVPYVDVVAGPGFGVGMEAPPYLLQEFSTCPTFAGWTQQSPRGDWGGRAVDKWNCAPYGDDGRPLLYKGLSPDSDCDGSPCPPYAGDPDAPVFNRGWQDSKFHKVFTEFRNDRPVYRYDDLHPAYEKDVSWLWSPPIEIPAGASVPTLMLAHQYSTDIDIEDNHLSGTTRVNHALNVSLELWSPEDGWVNFGPLEPQGGYTTEEQAGIQDSRTPARSMYYEQIIAPNETNPRGVHVDRDCPPSGGRPCLLDSSIQDWWWWPQGLQPRYRPLDTLLSKGAVFPGGSPWTTDVIPLHGTHFGEGLNVQGSTVRLRFQIDANERTNRTPDLENDWGWRIGGLAVLEGDTLTRDITIEAATLELSYDPFELGVGPGTAIPVQVTVRNRGAVGVADVDVEVVGEDLRAAPGTDPRLCHAATGLAGILEAGKSRNVTLDCVLPAGQEGGLLALRASTSMPREDFLGNNQQRVRGHFEIVPSPDAALFVDATPLVAAAGTERDVQIQVRNLGNVRLDDAMVTLEVLDITDPSRPPLRVHRQTWQAESPLPVQEHPVPLTTLMALDENPLFVPPRGGTYTVMAWVDIPGVQTLSQKLDTVLVQASEVLYLEDFDPSNSLDSGVMPGLLEIQDETTWARQPNNGPDGSPHLRAGDTTRGEITPGADAIVELPPLNLATLRGATLTFRHRYDLESGFDAARVEMSVDRGKTWGPLAPRPQPQGGLPEGHPSIPLVGVNAILDDAVECSACAYTGSSEDLPGNRDGWVSAEYDLGRQSRFFHNATVDPFSLDGMAAHPDALPWSVGPAHQFLDESWILDEPSAQDNQRYWWIQNNTYSEPRPLTANQMWWSGSAGELNPLDGQIPPVNTTMEIPIDDIDDLDGDELVLAFWDWRAGWQGQMDDDRQGTGGVYRVSIAGQGPAATQRTRDEYTADRTCSQFNANWRGLTINPPWPTSSQTYTTGDGTLNVTMSLAAQNTRLDFAVNEGFVEAVLLQADSNGTIYEYHPREADGDTGLTAPKDEAMQDRTITRIRFCYLYVEVEPTIMERRTDGWAMREVDLTPFLDGGPISVNLTYISGSANGAQRSSIATDNIPTRRPWEGEVEDNRGWFIDSLRLVRRGADGMEEPIVENDGHDATGVQTSIQQGDVEWGRVSLGGSARDGGWHIGTGDGSPVWRFAADNLQGYPNGADSRLVTPVVDLRQYKGDFASFRFDHRYQFHGTHDDFNLDGDPLGLGRAIDGGAVAYQVVNEATGAFGPWQPLGATPQAPELGLQFYGEELQYDIPGQQADRQAMGYPSIAGSFFNGQSLGATFPTSSVLLQSGSSFIPFPIANVFSGDSEALHPDTDGWDQVDWDVSHLIGKQVRFAFHAWTNPSHKPSCSPEDEGFGMKLDPFSDFVCKPPLDGWTVANVGVHGQQFQGEPIQLRFRVATDGSMPKGEWSIDDILVVGQPYEQSIVVRTDEPLVLQAPETEVVLEGEVRNVGSAPRTGLALIVEAFQIDPDGGDPTPITFTVETDLETITDHLPAGVTSALGPFELSSDASLPLRLNRTLPEGEVQIHIQVLEDVGDCDLSGACQTRYEPVRNEQGAGLAAATWTAIGEDRTDLQLVPPRPDRADLVLADPPVPDPGQRVTLEATLHNNGTTTPEVEARWTVTEVIRKGCPVDAATCDQPGTLERLGQQWVLDPVVLTPGLDAVLPVGTQFTPPAEGLYHATLEIRGGDNALLDKANFELLAAGAVEPYYLIDFAQTTAQAGGWGAVPVSFGQQSPPTIDFRQFQDQFLWGVTQVEFNGGKDYCNDGGCTVSGAAWTDSKIIPHPSLLPTAYGMHGIAEGPVIDLGRVIEGQATLALRHGHAFTDSDGAAVEARPLLFGSNRAAFECADPGGNTTDAWFRFSPVPASDLQGLARTVPGHSFYRNPGSADPEPYYFPHRQNPLGDGPIIGGPVTDEEILRFPLYGQPMQPACPPGFSFPGDPPESLVNYTLQLRLRAGTTPWVNDPNCSHKYNPQGCPESPRPGNLGWQIDSLGITAVDVELGPGDRELPMRDGFTKRFNLRVTNHGPLEETLQVGLSPDLLSADPTWFTFPPANVTLAPGESQVVPFEVDIPAEPKVQRGPYRAFVRATSSLDPSLFSQTLLTLDLAEHPLPDLATVLDVQAEEPGQPPEPGELAHIVTTVHNDGLAVAEAVPVRVEAVSLNSTGAEVGRSTVGVFELPELEPEEDVTHFTEWVPRTPGMYRIEVVADPEGRLVEGRLDNSRAVALVEVVPPQRADVRVSELSFDGVGEDGYALEGGLVTIVANITNRGIVAATGIQVSILAGSAQLLEVTLDSLSPGESREVSALRIASPGEAVVRALAIVPGTADGSGGSSHELRRILRVRGIDLAFQAETDPLALAPGGVVTTRIDVNNTGNAVEKVLFSLDPAHEGWGIAATPNPVTVAPGSSAWSILTLRAPDDAVAGTYNLTVLAAPQSHPGTRQPVQVPVQVEARVDAPVATLQNATAPPGPAWLPVLVQSRANIPQNVSLVLAEPDWQEAPHAVTLEAGQNASLDLPVTVPAHTPPGEVPTWVVVQDEDGVVLAEARGSLNVTAHAAGSAQWSGRPTIALSNLTARVFQATLNVSNDGNVPFEAEAILSRLADGVEATAGPPVTVAPGAAVDLQVHVRVSPEFNALAEGRADVLMRSNHTGSGPSVQRIASLDLPSLGTLPDLAITDIFVTPRGTVAANKPVQVTITVENLGFAESPATELYGYVNGEAVGAYAIEPLGEGGTTQVNLTWAFPTSGDYIVHLVADGNGNLTELHDDNNGWTQEVEVEAGDLVQRAREVPTPPPSLILTLLCLLVALTRRRRA